MAKTGKWCWTHEDIPKAGWVDLYSWVSPTISNCDMCERDHGQQYWHALYHPSGWAHEMYPGGVLAVGTVCGRYMMGAGWGDVDSPASKHLQGVHTALKKKVDIAKGEENRRAATRARCRLMQRWFRGKLITSSVAKKRRPFYNQIFWAGFRAREQAAFEEAYFRNPSKVMMDWIVARPSLHRRLTSWEQSFVEDMPGNYAKWGSFTARQREVITSINRKLGGPRAPVRRG